MSFEGIEHMGRLFGTDGVRGIANQELTCELAMKIGRAAAAVLASDSRRTGFVIGMDPRASSGMLAAAMAAGICSAGGDVQMLGVVPTPAVAYLAGVYGADAGIMISASHNSAEYNGIKLFSGDGFKLPDETEEQIEALVSDETYMDTLATGSAVGRVTDREDAADVYVEHLLKTTPLSPEGVSLAVDCANGAASATARKLFSALGADCRILNDGPDGMNINERCGSTHMDDLRRYVVENRLDMGVAFDGDADRCMCVDGDGNIVDGDFMMTIFAKDMLERGKLHKNTVVGTVMSNFGLSRFCEENGIRLVRADVGDRYVLEEMLKNDYSFGGEQSGHLIFREYATTGDGQLTAIRLIDLLKRQKLSLAEAASIMKRFPQVMMNVGVRQEGKARLHTDPVIMDAMESEKSRLGDEGRLLVRASGTEPLIRVMAEGFDEYRIRACVERIARLIADRLSEYSS